jgi:hypothetical protein
MTFSVIESRMKRRLRKSRRNKLVLVVGVGILKICIVGLLHVL